MPSTLQAELLPKQIEFLRAKEREVMYSGAFGAGKSRALCWGLVLRAQHPGAVELLCRKVNKSLKTSTLKTLLEPDGDLPAVLPPGTYTHNKSMQSIRIKGGGEILYFGLDDPLKIGSTPATGVHIDEAVEINEEDYTALRGRVRVKVAGLPRQIRLVTNPGAPSHHLAQRFGLADGTEAAYDARVISTRSADNFFLPADYLADLESFDGVARQKYYEGLWVAAEGLVYPKLADCVLDNHEEPPVGDGDYDDVGGVDFGWRNPFCALAGRIYLPPDQEETVLYVYSERYLSEVAIEEHGQAMFAEHPNTLWSADSEDPEAIHNLRKAGCSVLKAKKGVKRGIGAVNGLIHSGRLFISPACENLIREASVYAYGKDDKEKPVGGMDHALDALQYMVTMIQRRGMMEWALEAVE